jgi:hypothetical protein
MKFDSIPSPETKGDREARQVRELVGQIQDAASKRRIHELPEGLSPSTHRAVLEELMTRGESGAIALHADEFRLQESDAEWLLEQGETSGIEQLFRRGRLDKDGQLRWIERLMNEKRIDLVEQILNQLTSKPKNIPGSVAIALVESGKIATVESAMESFRDGDLPESIALALIARGPKGVWAAMGYRHKFVGFSQKTFDALFAENPLLLETIRENLDLFHGLNAEAAARLRAAGFEKDIAKNPSAFE